MATSVDTTPPSVEIFYFHREISYEILFLTLSIVFTILRFISRKTSENASWGWDDYFIPPALAMLIGNSVSRISELHPVTLICELRKHAICTLVQAD